MGGFRHFWENLIHLACVADHSSEHAQENTDYTYRFSLRFRVTSAIGYILG